MLIVSSRFVLPTSNCDRNIRSPTQISSAPLIVGAEENHGRPRLAHASILAVRPILRASRLKRDKETLMSTKSQALRSHPEDSRGEHSKASQKASPSNSQHGTTSTNVHESRDVIEKTKPSPAHVGPHKQQGQERDSLNQSQANRVPRPVPGDAREVLNGAAKARRSGPHGSVVHTDGTSQATPSKKQIVKFGK